MSTPTESSIQAPRRLGTGRKLIIAAVVVACLAWLGRFVYNWLLFEETDDAYIAGHIHQVSPQADGTVKQVLVHENQTVKAGDVLVRLDPLAFELALRRAQAALAQAKADRSRAEAAVVEAGARIAEAQARSSQAEAEEAQAAAQADLARINRDRNQRLFHESGAATQSDVDTTDSAFTAAEAKLSAAKANVAAAAAAIASSKAAHESAVAQGLAVRAAEASGGAAVADAQRRLAYATIVAPADGRIGNKNVETGNRVLAGQTLFALVEPHPWVVANFKETQLAKMHAGLPVEITIDALPDMTIKGTVDSIAPASGAEFALLPADNATGNFTKVVQRVPVKISIDPASAASLGDRIRPGLSVVASVRVR